MRTLEQALLDHDLIVLRVIAEWLELDLTGADKAESVEQLAAALATADLQEQLEYLEPEETAALAELVRQGGRAPVAVFSRDHGEVRAMGPGRLEREEPWLDPISPAEALWYRGFLYRGFDQTGEGTLEFYYLPHELLAKLAPASAGVVRESPATTTLEPVDAPEQTRPPLDDAVDDLTTLLALAQRTGLQPDRLPDLHGLLMNPDRDRRSLLLTLATEMSLLRRTEDRLRPTRRPRLAATQPRGPTARPGRRLEPQCVERTAPHARPHRRWRGVAERPAAGAHGADGRAAGR
ncbi:MAG: hypothetical protein IPH95_21690 [Candidatus Promineofilum sp.]|nr:hypothetical protein [Promineifilum sp.]